jgi:protein gp37
MGEKTGIDWCDATFNPWVGCTKVSDGCRYCYAERENKQYGYNPAGWGPGVSRKRTSEKYWKGPKTWAKKAFREGVTKRVFCGSWCDILDPDVPEEWHTDLWRMINQLGWEYPGALEWLLLTKRSERIEQFLPERWLENPPDYVRLGVTAEDQPNADRRIPDLLRVWRGKNFVSIEPMLSNVNLIKVMQPNEYDWQQVNSIDEYEPEELIEECEAECDWVNCGTNLVENPEWRERESWRDYQARKYAFSGSIHWVIAGCENGPRAMEIDWVRSLRYQCQVAKVPFFLKQMVINGKLTHMPELDGRRWQIYPEVGR